MIIGISGKIGSGKDTVGEIIRFLWDIKNTKQGQLLTVEDFIAAPSDADSSNPYQIKKFADKLKDIVCLLIGCTREQLEDREFKEKELGEEWVKYRIITKGLPNYYVSTLQEAEANVRHSNQRYVKVMMTPRLMLQLLGTECGREIIHPDIWVNALFADYKCPCNNCRPVECDSLANWIVTDVRFPNEAQAIKDKGGIVIRVNRYDENGMPYKTLNNHPSETALDNYKFDEVIENNGSIEELIEKVKKLNII